ncbi:MAG: hypothetical protein LQ350_002118 [Teloschistes chrysophthalmus]|nr:MAG: hypothetical protein LQ350_002118 [Niorma chrysophthalma]
MSKHTLHLPTRNLTRNLLLHQRPLSRIPLRNPASHYAFHTTPHPHSALFNLGGLSTSRESQYLSKERGIPRTEFSPHLELIRSSEVDTQKRASDLPTPPASKRPKATISNPPGIFSDARNQTVARAPEKFTTLTSNRGSPPLSQLPATTPPTLAHLQDSLTRLQTSHNALEARIEKFDKRSDIFLYILVATMALMFSVTYKLPDWDTFVEEAIRKFEEERAGREEEVGIRGEREMGMEEGKGREMDEVVGVVEEIARPVATKSTPPRRKERAWSLQDLVWARRD